MHPSVTTALVSHHMRDTDPQANGTQIAVPLAEWSPSRVLLRRPSVRTVSFIPITRPAMFPRPSDVVLLSAWPNSGQLWVWGWIDPSIIYLYLVSIIFHLSIIYHLCIIYVSIYPYHLSII